MCLVFFPCSHLPFCTPRNKDTKTCEKSMAFFTPWKMNIHHFNTCEVCRKTCRSHAIITHRAPRAEIVGHIATHGAARMRQPATVSTPSNTRRAASRITHSRFCLIVSPRPLPKQGNTFAVSPCSVSGRPGMKLMPQAVSVVYQAGERCLLAEKAWHGERFFGFVLYDLAFGVHSRVELHGFIIIGIRQSSV